MAIPISVWKECGKDKIKLTLTFFGCIILFAIVITKEVGMDYQGFCQWLKNDKNMTERSARDVVSRCKRIQKITGIDALENCTESRLIGCEDFSACSMFIKSQLKRALFLYDEFIKEGSVDEEVDL